MGTEGSGLCGQFQRSFGCTSALSCSLCSVPVGLPPMHTGDTGLPPEKALKEEPWLQATTGAVVEKSKAEAEGQEKAPGKELQPLVLLLCSALHLLSLFCHYVNVVVIETSSRPRQAQLAQSD